MFRRLMVAALACCLALSTAAQAQSAAKFPEQPIRIIIAFGPGGFADITSRLLSERLGRILGQQVLVDNRPGAGGIPAAQAALGTKPDGYTMLMYSNGTAISKSLYKSLPYEIEKDFVPVALVAFYDLCILVKKDSPYKTLGDLLADARARPGKLNFGTINPGSTQNLSAELFKSTANINVQIVPFKTTPDVARSLIGGDVDFAIESYAALKAQIDSGGVRVLATTAGKKAEYLKDVPPVKDAGVPGYEVVGWNAMMVPAGTPPDVIAKLNDAINKVTGSDDFKKRMLDLGTWSYVGPPADLGKQLHNDIAKWAAVIKKANIPQE